MIDWLKAHWVEIGVVIIAVNTFLKAVRDAIDKTPETDDNKFERFVTLVGKVCGYLFKGKRPNA